ncbi:MAG: hypothetical protein JSV62_15895 [Promethearchaeota archaeon]|nr:MAG: hypothetical protein JSV62_15895 [Candidatus Lokiarchaeota archaeon]
MSIYKSDLSNFSKNYVRLLVNNNEKIGRKRFSDGIDGDPVDILAKLAENDIAITVEINDNN